MGRLSILLAIAILVPSRAIGGTIVFEDSLSEPPGIKELDDLSTFSFTINDLGSFASNYLNLTGSDFTDFHFISSAPQPDGGNLHGADFSSNRMFADTTGSPTSINFVKGSVGGGIANDRIFSIIVSGFAPGTVITARPSVPEPSTLALLSVGALGILAVGLLGRRAS